MTITFTSTNGLFTRLGKIFGLGADIKTHQLDIVTEVDDIMDEYEANRDYAVQIQSSVDSFIAASGSPFSTLRAAAQKTVIEQVNADNPQLNKSLPLALMELIEQMDDNSESVDGTTVSANVTPDGGNTGDGTILTSFVDIDGNSLVYARAEDITAIATTASSFLLTGQVAEQNPFSPYWPAGSGGTLSVSVVDPSDQAFLTNGDFEGFNTGGEPDDWTIDTGTGGSTIDETATAYEGSKALAFIGNGSEQTQISQAVTLTANTKYILTARVRTSGSPAAGVLRISVRDGSDTAVGTSEITVDLTGVGTSYTLQSAAFSVADNIPTGTEVIIELTTALTNTESVYIDNVTLSVMSQFAAPGGPYVAVIKGATDFIVNDEFVVAVTNNGEGAFIREFDRYFNMYNLALYLPQDTSGSETIDDALIS